MFQLDDDPPSPPPGKDMTPEEIQAEKIRRAMLGIPGEKSGRPSIKDMEKEIVDKLKNQKLKEERIRSDIDVREVSRSQQSELLLTNSQLRRAPQHDRSGGTRESGWGPPVKQNHVQASLSERLRERDVYRQGEAEDDGW
jgi:hypothetical protein